MVRLSAQSALPIQGASKPTAATGLKSSPAILYYVQQSTGVVGLDGCSAGCHNTRLWCTHSELGCMLNHVVDQLQRLQQLLMVCGTLLVLHHQLPEQRCILSEGEEKFVPPLRQIARLCTQKQPGCSNTHCVTWGQKERIG